MTTAQWLTVRNTNDIHSRVIQICTFTHSHLCRLFDEITSLCSNVRSSDPRTWSFSNDAIHLNHAQLHIYECLWKEEVISRKYHFSTSQLILLSSYNSQKSNREEEEFLWFNIVMLMLTYICLVGKWFSWSLSFRAFTLSHSASTSMLSLITSRVTEYFSALSSGHRGRRDDSHEWSTACVYLSCSSSSVCVVSTQRPWWHLVKRSFFSFVRPCCFLPFSIFALDSSHTAPNKLQKQGKKLF